MHDTALKTGKLFFERYCRPDFVTVLDVGSYDVNGSLRSVAPSRLRYVGVDLVAGPGVDMVLQDPHKLPFEDNSFDMVVSTSCFEHDNMFWLTFLECMRVLKRGGFFYISAPSNGWYHPYPKDNWRFYPDSGLALQEWSVKNNLPATLIESFVLDRETEQWNDTVMVFGKGHAPTQHSHHMIHSNLPGVCNLRVVGQTSLLNQQYHTQDQLIMQSLSQQLKQSSSSSPTAHAAPKQDASRFVCHVCGSHNSYHNTVLWPQLIQEWEISPEQANYIDIQQGTACAQCHTNVRSSALARAICDAVSHTGALQFWLQTKPTLRMLEINQAGTLHNWLKRLDGHVFAAYPQCDMARMQFADNSFDMVVHSDTLEHVSEPLRALKECWRILKPNGVLCFTVPTVVERLSRSRQGMSGSYHGPSTAEDYRVHTEFGADLWRWPIEAGFDSVKLTTMLYPSGIAITAHKK